MQQLHSARSTGSAYKDTQALDDRDPPGPQNLDIFREPDALKFNLFK